MKDTEKAYTSAEEASYYQWLNSTIDRLEQMRCSSHIDSNFFCYNAGSSLPGTLSSSGTSRFYSRDITQEKLRLKEYFTTLVKYIEEVRGIAKTTVYNLFFSMEYFLKGLFEEFTNEFLDSSDLKHGDTHVNFNDIKIDDIINKQLDIASVVIRADCLEKVFSSIAEDTSILGEYNESA
jgi:hypothetical protein